jgi:hypothetical protein
MAIFLGMIDEVDTLEQRAGARRRLRLAALQHLDLGEADILGHAHMRVEFEILEHHADAGAQFRQVGPAVADRDGLDRDPPLLEGLESVDAFYQGALARARRAADDDDLALGDRGRAIGEDAEIAVPFAEMLDLDHIA